MIDKTYQPSEVEGRIYAAWEAGGRLPRRPARSARRAEPYCIVIPPPNVTGSLHMGHALNNTLQDMLCRFERMRGKRRAVAARHRPRRHRHPDGGRAPADGAPGARPPRHGPRRSSSSGSGRGRRSPAAPSSTSSSGSAPPATGRASASPWTRACRARCSRCSSTLYNEGLIYKDKRLVNWDPKLLTAISDLEVQQVEVKGNLWHFDYPIEGIATTFIIVATTRPETMLGDTAVAVHPGRRALKHLIGKTAILPLVGRRIPIVADDYADPEKGTGAVKITPAHDFNDFEVGKRHDLPLINILDVEGKLALERQRGVRSTACRRRPSSTRR